MVFSKIKYGSIIYGLTTKENINKIQVIQNRLLKVLTCKTYRFSTNKLHNELSILKIDDLVKQELLTFTFNYIHGNLPVVFENYFHHRWALGEALAGNKRLRFIIPIHTTKIGENTVKVQAFKVFNDLAIGTSINCKLKTFRKTIKSLLLCYTE